MAIYDESEQTDDEESVEAEIADVIDESPTPPPNTEMSVIATLTQFIEDIMPGAMVLDGVVHRFDPFEGMADRACGARYEAVEAALKRITRICQSDLESN